MFSDSTRLSVSVTMLVLWSVALVVGVEGGVPPPGLAPGAAAAQAQCGAGVPGVEGGFDGEEDRYCQCECEHGDVGRRGLRKAPG